MAAALDESGQYRVLRKLQPRHEIEPADGSPTRMGIFLDLETTGTDPARDEIIEFAMVPFTYALDGRIFEVGEPYQRLRQPSTPIPPETTRITGIDDAMVEGQTIDPDEVSAFAAGAAIIIAHNASFDRRFEERFASSFNTKAWACSMTQVDWVGEGFEGTKLSYIAGSCGFFYDRHRATNDCYAGIEILSRRMATSGQPAFASLLAAARKPTWRIWAENSPFELKDALKARGYRWNPDGSGSPKAWFIDVDDAGREEEMAFLRREIYQREIDLLSRQISAYDRFSDRC